MLVLLDPAGATHELGGDAAAVDAADLAAATGWSLKPEGLCRGEVCVPLLGRTVALDDGRIDLAAWATALGLPLAVDEARGVAAVLADPAATASLGGESPDVALPDVDGNVHAFSELAGRKRVLVTWASWCGCRHELPAWQALQDELGPAGLSIYAVALDESVDAARPWIDAAAPAFPAVIDTAHVTAERFGITNVPSTVWVDEAGTVVKPPTIAPGDDQFRDFTQIEAADHHDALRRWVLDGEAPPAAGVEPRDADGQLALAERRIAAWLHEQGDDAGAAEHLRRATELAPWDWTVRRAGIALLGGDPFLGEEFLAFWETWDAAGRPGYTPTTP